MIIYVGHSKQMDYVNELYNPIMNSDIFKNDKYNFLFPHIPNNDLKNDRDFYNNINLFFADITLPATD